MSTLLSHYENHASHRYVRSALFPLIREVIKREYPLYSITSTEILTVAHYSYSMNQGCYRFATFWRFMEDPERAKEQIITWINQLKPFTLLRYAKYYTDTHRVTV